MPSRRCPEALFARWHYYIVMGNCCGKQHLSVPALIPWLFVRQSRGFDKKPVTVAPHSTTNSLKKSSALMNVWPAFAAECATNLCWTSTSCANDWSLSGKLESSWAPISSLSSLFFSLPAAAAAASAAGVGTRSAQDARSAPERQLATIRDALGMKLNPGLWGFL